jgi:hypothetical protein
MSQELSSSVNLQDLIAAFTAEQLDYLAVRPFVKYDKDAAKIIGLAAETVSRWENKQDVDMAVRMMKADGVIVASEILRRHLPEAAMAVTKELKNKRADVRLKAAKEILDRGGVASLQRIEHSGSVDTHVGADPKLAEFMALVDAARARQGDPPAAPTDE